MWLVQGSPLDGKPDDGWKSAPRQSTVDKKPLTSGRGWMAEKEMTIRWMTINLMAIQIKAARGWQSTRKRSSRWQTVR